MPVFRLPTDLAFPDPAFAGADGLLAAGGDLRPERLLLAYGHGIFPWPHAGYPLLWFSPDPRTVLRTADLRVSRRLRRVLRQGRFEVRLDTAFRAVIEHCARVKRSGQRGTWITPSMIQAYSALHDLGYAHSAEAWQGGRLVGGLYGVCLGRVFTGESMFTLVPDASKVALATLVRQLERWGVEIFDAQVHSDHVARFGATPWPRERFLAVLKEDRGRPDLHPTRCGRWRLGAGGDEPS